MSHVISLSCITIWDFSEGLGIGPADGRAAGAGAGTCSLKHGEMSSAAGWVTAGGLHTKNYLWQVFASASREVFASEAQVLLLEGTWSCLEWLGMVWSFLPVVVVFGLRCFVIM